MFLNLITSKSVYVSIGVSFRSSEEIDLLEILRAYLPQMAPSQITINLDNGHCLFLTEGGWIQQKLLPSTCTAIADRFKHNIANAHDTVRTILS